MLLVVCFWVPLNLLLIYIYIIISPSLLNRENFSELKRFFWQKGSRHLKSIVLVYFPYISRTKAISILVSSLAEWEQMYRAKHLVLRTQCTPHLCYRACELRLWALALQKSGGGVWDTPGRSSPCPPGLLGDVNKCLENKDRWDARYRCGLLSHTKLFLFSETRAKFSLAPCWLWVMQWNCNMLAMIMKWASMGVSYW